jgi:predicted dehydrogenase
MSSSPLRWGLLGAGSISRDFARDLASAHTGRLAAIGSRSPEAAAAFAAEFPGCRPHGSYKTFLADPEIDAVYIGTPHPLHAEQAIQALRAGKHVLCEKPFAMNAAEAETVFVEAQRAGCFVMEAFKDRCHPLTDAVLQTLPRLGQVWVVEATFSFGAPFNPKSRLFARELGGGSILDVGCYTAAFARRIAGATLGRPFAEPTDFAALANVSPITGTDMVAAATLRFENGLLAKLACGLTVTQGHFARIYGTEGMIDVPEPWERSRAGAKRATLTLNGKAPETIEVIADRPVFALEADVVGECVAAGKITADVMSWADTLGNLRLLDRWLAAVGVSYA